VEGYDVPWKGPVAPWVLTRRITNSASRRCLTARQPRFYELMLGRGDLASSSSKSWLSIAREPALAEPKDILRCLIPRPRRSFLIADYIEARDGTSTDSSAHETLRAWWGSGKPLRTGPNLMPILVVNPRRARRETALVCSNGSRWTHRSRLEGPAGFGRPDGAESADAASPLGSPVAGVLFSSATNVPRSRFQV